MRRLLLMMLSLLPAGTANSQTVTQPADPRIRTVDYIADDVIPVSVSTGVVTRIVLEHGEKIIAAATGVPSKCDSDAYLWCVVANAEANEIWIKPKAGARHNNLELKTDRRDYSFDLRVGTGTTYRVVLRYPIEAVTPPSEQVLVSERIETAEPVVRNLDYTLQGNRRGADITPSAIFDDGTFTYFRFPGNTEVPTIFVIGADGQEARANFNMTGDYVVVQRLGRKFVLRLRKSVVSVFNEAFDPEGVAPTNGTTVDGVERTSVGMNDGR